MADASHDSQLTDRLKAGADSAWTAFFDAHSPRVWTYVTRLIGGDRHAVADAVQETFFAAARGIHSFDADRGTLIAWLLGIAHRQAALYWRKQSRHTAEPLNSPVQAREDNAELALEHAELSTAVRRVLASLPTDMAALLIGRYLDEQSARQQAEQLGVSEEAVRSRLMRARDRFREAFAARHRDLVEVP